MVRCTSLFSQVLSLIGRVEFATHVKELKAERGSKGFSCWGQFVGMLFCQMAQAQSLREICDGLRCCLGKLNHLGLKEAPRRSTLSYANAHRPWQLFERTFYEVLEGCRKLAPQKKFRFRNKLLSLDASVIDLCVTLFDWAKFRQTKGAVKLHLLLDHDGYLPSFALITEGCRHEVTVARTLKLPAGSVVAMDRGYNDYRLFGQWTAAGVWFVTKMKSNTSYEVAEKGRALVERNILSDERIGLTGPGAEKKCPYRLRRVVVWDEAKQESIVLLTNHLEFGATTISAIYRDRWQIELFFKALKQNLKVKTFVGTSANALRIQIWTALIAMLLLKYLQLKSRLGWALSNLVALLRWNLFTYRDLWEWMDDPFETPPLSSPPQQLVLPAMNLDSRRWAKA
jgi:uncharacterized protein DUF4372/DDE family transposase